RMSGAPPRAVPSFRPSAPPPPPPSLRKPPVPKPEVDARTEGSQATRPPLGVERPPTADGLVLIDLLTTRIGRLTDSEDRVGLARAHLEPAIVHEPFGEDGEVEAHLDAALDVDPALAPGHALRRRRLHPSRDFVSMLKHLDGEIATAAGETTTIELLAA